MRNKMKSTEDLEQSIRKLTVASGNQIRDRILGKLVSKLDASLIGKLIGPGGSNIKQMEKNTGAKISVTSDSGDVAIFAPNRASYQAAEEAVAKLAGSVRRCRLIHQVDPLR